MADGKQSSVKKIAAVGVLAAAVIAGVAYKFLAGGNSPAGQNNSQTAGAGPGQNAQDAAAPSGQPAPRQNPNAPLPPGEPPNRDQSQQTAVTPQPIETSAPSSAEDIQVRLISPISAKSSNEGDQFQAKVENGPYREGILTGTIKKLVKGKKNAEIELEFAALNGKAIPVRLDLADVSNSHGVKGVDDENNRIVAQDSKKKLGAVTAIGTEVGAGLERLMKHSNKSALTDAEPGGGYSLNVKITSRAKDIELSAGSQFTLRETKR